MEINEKIEELIKLIRKNPGIIDKLLGIARRLSASADEFQVIVNVNRSPHHDILGAIKEQFSFKHYVDLTEGSLSFKDMLLIPKLINDIPKQIGERISGNIGVVLSGHPLMQLLALTQAVSSYDTAYAVQWIPDLKTYATFKLQKFKENFKAANVQVDTDVVFPVKPFGGITQSLKEKGLTYSILCDDVSSVDDIEHCVSVLLGAISRGAIIGADAPKGILALAGADCIEGHQKTLKLVTYQQNNLYYLELNHLNFRSGEIHYKTL